MIKVYIASPYTKGDVAVNVKTQIDAVDRLMNKGFAPFAPLYSHFQHIVHPRPWNEWLEVDLEWVKVCDCVLRLSGDSDGADEEVRVAKSLGIPIFYSFEDLYEAFDVVTLKLPRNPLSWQDEVIGSESFKQGVEKSIKNMRSAIMNDAQKDEWLLNKIGPVSEKEKLIASILFKYQRGLIEKVIKELS